MAFRVRIKASAAKSLRHIDREDRHRIIEAIDRLQVEPAAGSALKGEFQGLRRLRVGSYRIIYEVDRGELTILIVRIGHRRDIYR